MYNKEDEGWGSLILRIAGALLAMWLMVSCCRGCSRYGHNMSAIKHGYCYDKNTQIIYIESYSGQYGAETTYSPYYDPNGNLCKYELATGKWIPVTTGVD